MLQTLGRAGGSLSGTLETALTFHIFHNRIKRTPEKRCLFFPENVNESRQNMEEDHFGKYRKYNRTD